jgi:hypothetical protein
MTKQLDKWLIECARNLNDGKLMAALSGDDVVAQELKYPSSNLMVYPLKEWNICSNHVVAIIVLDT